MPGETSGRAAAAGEGAVGAGSRRRWVGLAVALALVALISGPCLRLSRLLLPSSEPASAVADVASERVLPFGPVVGFAADAETHAWLGIPFARPPTGSLRWRAPQEPEPWAETLDALAFAPPCPQLGSRLAGVPAEDDAGHAGQEDCLYLNVWAPRVEADSVPTGAERWPVMVWIHGGGNTRGSPGLRMYDGALLAGRERVVVVSIAYRLGPLGFFSHPALRESAADVLEASGNFGLLDQIRALTWVASAIEEFGGDPENVTIFGESAGGLDVYALLLSSRARGLFHRAIAQSAGLQSVTRAEAESTAGGAPWGTLGSGEAVALLLSEAGVVPDAAAARGYAESLEQEDLLDFLRGLSANEILDVYREREHPASLRVPKPIRDGALLPEGDWLERMRAGDFARVPVLAGANRDEQKLLLSQDPEHVRRRFGLFYTIRDPRDFERRARLHSDWWMLRGVIEPLEAMFESGHEALYAYRFDWDALAPVLGQEMGRIVGAGHGFELPFLFGRFDLGDRLLSRLLYPDAGRMEREALSARMMGYWAGFARDGRPGQGGADTAPVWQAWRASGRAGGLVSPPRWMVLDGRSDGGLRMSAASVTREGLETAIESDPSLSGEARCALLSELLDRHERLTVVSLAAASSGRCPVSR